MRMLCLFFLHHLIFKTFLFCNKSLKHINMIKVFNYGDNDVTFKEMDGVLMINATEMTRVFNKEIRRYFEQRSNMEFVITLYERNYLSTKDSEISRSLEISNLHDSYDILSKYGLILPNGRVDSSVVRLSELFSNIIYVERQGVFGQGVWVCKELALDIARWLSPRFNLWCNEKILELFSQGVATIDNNAETLQHAISVLEDKLESYREDAEYAQQVLKSEDCFTTTEVAKGFGLSAMKLNKILRDMKIQFYDRNCWFLYSPYHSRGYTEMRVTPYIDKNGRSRSYRTMVWTEKGIKYIQKRLKNKEVIK